MLVETNTFDYENFEYPNACACCCQNEPSAAFKLVFSVMELPDGGPDLYGGDDKRRVFNDYVCRVPICTQCQSVLNRKTRLCWGAGAILGAGVGLGALLFSLDAITPQLAYLTAGAAAVVSAIVFGFILKSIFARVEFARYDGHKGTLTFKNKAYQAAFDKLNLLNLNTAGA